MNNPIVVIAGATASGKTDVSVELARRISGEIVVADSMQIYRGMDIGTAKLPAHQRDVRHFCIDILEPGEPFSSALYQQYAREAFSQIDNCDKKAILSGGTGFYIRSAIDDYQFIEGEQTDNPIRQKYNDIAHEKGSLALWEILFELDSKSANAIHPNNTKRIVRAIEMHEFGQSYADQLDNLKKIPQLYEAKLFCIDIDREVLAKRINERVDKMRESGLVEEVKGLIDRGFRDAVTASSAIGYKEIVQALDQNCTMDEAFESIKTATRRYAKRQRSWFNSDTRYLHIDATLLDINQIADQIEEMLTSSAG